MLNEVITGRNQFVLRFDLSERVSVCGNTLLCLTAEQRAEPGVWNRSVMQ